MKRLQSLLGRQHDRLCLHHALHEAMTGAHAHGKRGEKDRTNKSVQGQSLCENEDEDHSHEELGLLRISSAVHNVSFTPST